MNRFFIGHKFNIPSLKCAVRHLLQYYLVCFRFDTPHKINHFNVAGDLFQFSLFFFYARHKAN